MHPRIIHIGLGKVASSTLQETLFPILAINSPNREYIGPQSEERIRYIKLFLEKKLEIKQQIHLQEWLENSKYILSYEGLLSWNPEFWGSSIQRLRELVGSDVQIILFLREPVSYLRSVYQQSLAIGVNKSPAEYFYTQSNPSLEPLKYHNIAFNLHQFNYLGLINMLETNFSDVKVFPISSLGNIKTVLSRLGVEDKLLEKKVETKLKMKHYNISYNNRSMLILIIFNKLIKVLGFPDYETNIELHHLKFKQLNISQKFRVISFRIYKKLRILDRFLKWYSRKSSGPKYKLPGTIYLNIPAVLSSEKFFNEIKKDNK